MKRMMLSIAMIAVGLAAGPTTFAQSKELAGSWTLDVEKSKSKEGPPVVVLTLTDKEFTVRFGDDKARVMTFKLDGTETVQPQGAKSKAAWKGNKLEATVVFEKGPTETITFSRDAVWLVMERQSDDGPMKLYLKKTPAGL